MFRLISVVCFAMFVCGCAASGIPKEKGRSNEPRQVVDRTWQWVSTGTPVEKIEVTTPERYTFAMNADGTAEVRFDCNRGGGRYEIAEGKLSFGPLMSTKMACPEDSLDGRFAKDLQRVSSFFLQDGLLYLELPDGSGTMRFREAP